MPPFSYQVKRTNIGGAITILGWRDTLNTATPPTWWLGSTEFQFLTGRLSIINPKKIIPPSHWSIKKKTTPNPTAQKKKKKNGKGGRGAPPPPPPAPPPPFFFFFFF